MTTVSKTCASGRYEIWTSCGAEALPNSKIEIAGNEAMPMAESTLPCVSIAPLGSPVVPLV